MQREIIDKANEIVSLIEKNKRDVKELEKDSKRGKTLYTKIGDLPYKDIDDMPKAISFEPWEIRLIIHNKKQRIAALEQQLERL